MKKLFYAIFFGASLLATLSSTTKNNAPTDTIHTSGGDLVVTHLGHASLMFSFKNKIIHIDPWSEIANYAELPKADLVLISHEHGDHCDNEALSKVVKDKALVYVTESCFQEIKKGEIIRNGDVKNILGIKVEAFPAYNIKHKDEKGQPYHPKGKGNGYVITFADKLIYIAGDTENIPEMKNLKKIEAAFLPMNLPWTMTPEMVVDAVKTFKPKILFPYHFAVGTTDLPRLKELMKAVPDVDLRIRNTKTLSPAK